MGSISFILFIDYKVNTPDHSRTFSAGSQQCPPSGIFPAHMISLSLSFSGFNWMSLVPSKSSMAYKDPGCWKVDYERQKATHPKDPWAKRVCWEVWPFAPMRYLSGCWTLALPISWNDFPSLHSVWAIHSMAATLPLITSSICKANDVAWVEYQKCKVEQMDFPPMPEVAWLQPTTDAAAAIHFSTSLPCCFLTQSFKQSRIHTD